MSNISHFISPYIEGKDVPLSTYVSILLLFCNYSDCRDIYVVAHSMSGNTLVMSDLFEKRSNVFLNTLSQTVDHKCFAFGFV